MKLKFVFAIMLFLTASAFAEDIYVAQSATGSNNGLSCASARAASWFNTSSSWGSGTGIIGAGDTVHLCGTISTMLTVQASGASGSPITILFEPNAKISLPYFTSTRGLIDMRSKGWIVIDGGSNGIIELTDNGTSLGHQTDGYGIDIGGASNLTIKNLNIRNLYVRTGTTEANGWGYAIFGSSGAVTGTSRITNNTMSDMSTCMIFTPNGSMEIDHNNCSRVSWGFAAGGGSPTNFLFHDNKLSDGYVWYQVNDVFHNDPFHVWTTGGNWSNAKIYNNDFFGDWGPFTTGIIYMECDGTASSCPIQIYNNIFRVTSSLTNGRVALKDALGVKIYNNYFTGPGNAIHQENGGSGGSWNTVAMNNVFVSVGSSFASDGTGSWATRDYNAYWNSPVGPDTHKVTANPMLDSNYGPQSGSPLIDAGSAISSFNIDRFGNSRPQGNAWDIGPVEYMATPPPNPPTGLTATPK